MSPANRLAVRFLLAAVFVFAGPVARPADPPKSGSKFSTGKNKEKEKEATIELKTEVGGGVSLGTDIKPRSDAVGVGAGRTGVKAGENEMEFGLDAGVGDVIKAGPQVKLKVKSTSAGENDDGVHPSSLSGFDFELKGETALGVKAGPMELSTTLPSRQEKKITGGIRFGENPYYKAQTLKKEVDKIFADETAQSKPAAQAATVSGIPRTDRKLVPNAALVIKRGAMKPDRWGEEIKDLQADYASAGKPLELTASAEELRIRAEDLSADEVSAIIRRFPYSTWDFGSEAYQPAAGSPKEEAPAPEPVEPKLLSGLITVRSSADTANRWPSVVESFRNWWIQGRGNQFSDLQDHGSYLTVRFRNMTESELAQIGQGDSAYTIQRDAAPVPKPAAAPSAKPAAQTRAPAATDPGKRFNSKKASEEEEERELRGNK